MISVANRLQPLSGNKRLATMMRPVYLFLLCAIAFTQHSFAQKRLKIAVFAPLYLDSAFDASLNYKHGKNFPKYINAGLEFYEGIQEAADSLEQEGMPLDIFVYDSRSASSSVKEVVKKGLDSIDLVVGHVNANEAKALANAVAGKNIPFINANLPNDAAVSDNPGYVILNSTLYTHCAAIYKHLQKSYALTPIVMFRKKGGQEDKLKAYFDQLSKTTASVPLKINYVTLENNFTEEDIKKHLKPDVKTTVIAGSLDINFANTIAQMLASANTTDPSILFAMPTWWDATNFSRSEFKGLEVMYSTPFYISTTNPFVIALANEFKSKYYSRPTDMFFRGYEVMYHFAHLLQLNEKNLGSSLSDKRFTVFTEFDIQPVLDSKTNTLDYFENKKIYFVKKVDGVVTAVY